MELSFNSILEWTKLTLRDPRMASLLAKAANFPLQVSIMLIVVTGVLSGLMSGMISLLVPPPAADPLTDPTAATAIETLGPFTLAGLTILGNLSLTYFVYWIGQKMGGKGSLEDIAAVSAILQIVMTVILVVQVTVRVLLPVLYFAVVMVGVYVFLRGLGHAVNVGHDFDDLGRSAGVIALAFVASVVIASVVFAILGIGPQMPVEGSGL